MERAKEKRKLERIPIRSLNASVEVKGARREASILNACEDGVCIAGPPIPVGTVVMLYVDAGDEKKSEISLYCRSIWTGDDGSANTKSGLSFLHTNKILFKQDLTSFSRIVDHARITYNQ